MGHATSAKYEQLCTYFNYAINQYYIANYKLLQETDAERKLAISRLRNSYWAIEQIKPLLAALPKEVKDQHVDLSIPNLELLQRSV